MSYPALVRLSCEADYRKHYETKYCRAPIVTFDGIQVRFSKSRFGHCFYESSKRNKIKDNFSIQRAERIDWIEAALHDASAELYVGWDKASKTYDNRRRVVLVVNDYVVIIRFTDRLKAEFVTAFVADSANSLARIKSGPKWRK